MQLSMKLESLDDIYSYTKKIYIDAGYETLDDVINASREDLLSVGFKNKYKPFRELQRIIHSNGLKFKYETLEYKKKLISENISLWELDLSKFMIKVLEKNNIFDSKTLYVFVKNNGYNFYKLCRSAISTECSCSNLLNDFFDFNVNFIDTYEVQYQKERKFYIKYKSEYQYLKLFFYNNDVSIDNISISNKSKDILKGIGINSLYLLIEDYYNSFVNNIEILNDGFYFEKVCKDYMFSDDIMKFLYLLLDGVVLDKKYSILKENIINSICSINNINIFDLGLSDDVYKRLNSNRIITVKDLLGKSKNEILNLYNCNLEIYEVILYSLCKKIILLKTNNYELLNNDLYVDKVFDLFNQYFECKNKKVSSINSNDCINKIIMLTK